MYIRLRQLVLPLLAFGVIVLMSCNGPQQNQYGPVPLIAKADGDKIKIFRQGDSKPIVTQNAKEDFRPYIHPIEAPDGKGTLTEYSPEHHKHQTGLYWGLTRVNDRDYFHNPGGEYWKKVSSEIIESEGEKVSWKTVYDLLDEAGTRMMMETQIWTMRVEDGQYFMELEWQGKAEEDILVAEHDYGGMFLRMPWKEGMNAVAVNTARQVNEKAEGQRSQWLDLGMQVEGRDDLAHITIYDHPQNAGYPTAWRVDGQLGVGPSRAIQGDWEIKEGSTSTFRHQIHVYTGEYNDVAARESFESYSGAGAMYSTASLWGIAQQEARNAKFLTPEEAIKESSIKKGYNMNMWASEPMITQPMAFCWDDKGRLWIAENRDYESRREGFSNDGESRILILEDTDQDGVADSKKVFLEGIPFPSAIAVGFDGLFLGAPPNFLFVPDKDRDDKGDMEDIEILLTGWGIRDRHETINSFHWGPDGWLYGLEGFATPSRIRKPNGDGKMYKKGDPFPNDIFEHEGVDIDGGVWRYHPTKHRFEVVSHGFSNPWGIDHDESGQLFITACVIPHMFHVIPGGIFHRQGGKHFNPYIYSDIQTIVDHRHRSAHGGARVYQSDAFPEEEHGRLFMANIHEHGVLSDNLVPSGSGFIAQHADDFMMANNAQWIGFSMEIGPGGNLYVLDWHDADICGNDVVHKETGRIFRIAPEKSLAENWEGRYGDLSKLSDLELVKLQTIKSDWHTRRARIILQSRAAKGKISKEASDELGLIYLGNPNLGIRLKAMWAIHATTGFTDEELLKSLSDKEEYVRAWAIQLATEDFDASAEILDKFVEMGKVDKSPVVRRYLAGALQRMKGDQRWDLATALLEHNEDVDDHNIPHMIWFGIESLMDEDVNRSLDLASSGKMPMIANYMSRRAADIGELRILVDRLGKRSPMQRDMLEGMLASIAGRSDVSAPDNWPGVYEKLKSNRRLKETALAIAQELGDAEAAKEFMTVLRDKSAPAEKRNQALASLAARQWEELKDILPELMGDKALRTGAIRALAAYEIQDLGWELMKQYNTFGDKDKLEAIQTFASRPVYGNILTTALKEGWIPKGDVPAYSARQLRRVVGNGFVEIWGPIDELSDDKAAAYEKYHSLLTDAAVSKGNIAAGKATFEKTCGACHQMYGEGGIIGPDLTGSDRANLDYILSNILDPSGEIQDAYKMMVITTQDGRTYAGNLVAENDKQVTLRVVGQDAVVISKTDIRGRETTPNSMMPEGLLKTLTDQEVIDLIAYLRTTKQVALK